MNELLSIHSTTAAKSPPLGLAYESSVTARRQRAASWAKHQRSIHDQDIQFRIDHGEMTEADFDRAEEDLEQRLLKSEKEVTQTDFDTFQSQVVTPLHALFTSRIETATSALTKLSSHLFDSAQSHSPNQPQEEGDDSAELLEKLTMLKWLFEAREALHRETYDLLSERNDKYKAIVTLPYKAAKNTQKQVEAEAFFARDARERQIAHDQAVSSRMEAFLKVIEGNVTRGVEIQLSAFWDIAPGILQLVHKIPGDRRVPYFFFCPPQAPAAAAATATETRGAGVQCRCSERGIRRQSLLSRASTPISLHSPHPRREIHLPIHRIANQPLLSLTRNPIRGYEC